MSRIFNFNAGPAILPQPVLEQVQDELLDWHHHGMSIIEMSHRSREYMEEVASVADNDLRELLNIPTNYKILFLQGGGRGQFAMVPLNLLSEKNNTADYVDTGVWSKMAATEAARYGQINLVASSAASGYHTIPPRQEWKLSKQPSYFHYVDNETVNGVEFTAVPELGNVPLICDMSSNILSRPLAVNKFGIIYAGAQKNIGPAGLTVVIVREDLIGNPLSFTPTYFNYKVHADNHSLFNTPPTFSWYVAGLVFKWLKQQGGVAALAEMHERRSQKLYEFIDNSEFYGNNVNKNDRSRINVIFQLTNENLTAKFLEEANASGFAGLKGHSVVGGMRASLYNALPELAVDALIDFMKDFAKNHA